MLHINSKLNMVEAKKLPESHKKDHTKLSQTAEYGVVPHTLVSHTALVLELLS